MPSTSACAVDLGAKAVELAAQGLATIEAVEREALGFERVSRRRGRG